MDLGHCCQAGSQQEQVFYSFYFIFSVSEFIYSFHRYEVEDVEEEEAGVGKKKYSLPADAIIPLPKSLPEPSKKLEFPSGKKVLSGHLYRGNAN